MKQWIVGQTGLKFLRSFLQDGGDLAKAASAAMHENDEILTWLPDGVGLGDVSFHGWPSQDPPDENIWEPLRELIRQFLGNGANHIAIVESGLMTPGEAFPNWTNFPSDADGISYVTCGGATGYTFDSGMKKQVYGLLSVFGFLIGGDVAHEQVSAVLDSAFPFHEIHVLTSLPEGTTITSGETIDGDLLKELGKRAEYISVGAYDGCGVMLWRRGPEAARSEESD